MSANEDFERLAAMYFDDTGHLAPGKDDPFGQLSMTERFAEFDRWQFWRITRPLPPTETWREYSARINQVSPRGAPTAAVVAAPPTRRAE